MEPTQIKKDQNERPSNPELGIGKTDNVKCPKCNTLKSSLRENHLTCYKWHYNKLTNPDVD